MKFHFFLLLFSCWATALLAQNPNPNPALDAFIQDEMMAERLPGLSSLMVKDGEIVWVESYGMANFATNQMVEDSTIFLLASVSKVFTGTAAMQLVEQGLLDLDQPINNYLPFNVDHPNSTTPLTARMLMTHTASIRDNFSVMENYYAWGDPTLSLAEVMERYLSTSGEDYDPNANFFAAAPGTDYRYSNIGIALLGYLVEVVAATNFSDYGLENTFDPLCMDRTRWFLSELDSSQVARPYTTQAGAYEPIPHYSFADYPNGLLRSSVLDLAHFMIAYLDGGQFGQAQVLNSSTIETMWSAQIPSIQADQGLVWYQEEIFLNGGGSTFLWGHNGGEAGVSTDMYFDPEQKIGLVVLANGEGTNLFIVDQLYNYALDLEASGVGAPGCEPVSALAEVAGPSAGVQVAPNPTDGWLQVRVPGPGAFHLQILNLQGQLVQEHRGENPEWTLFLPESGVFYLHLTNAEGQSWQQMIIRK